MELNPYARYLDGYPHDAILDRVLAVTPAEIAKLAETLGPARLAASPAPGKWSPAQVIAHLADCELAFGFRLRQTLAQNPARYPGEAAHTIQPFDQDRWAASYSRVTAEQALVAFTALRDWNLILLRNTPAEAVAIPVHHPER
ncbi:MAG TPA: DinB family protein, partial [Acidobacteriaceae bacterium]